jgi:cob(I)alamin adenosyltransferase
MSSADGKSDLANPKESKPDKKPRSRLLPKIYTKAGDFGFTTLLGSTMKVPKWDIRIKAYGAVDELNAHLGQVLEIIAEIPHYEIPNLKKTDQSEACESLKPLLVQDITTIQRTLFVMSSWLARHVYNAQDTFGLAEMKHKSVAELETRIDEMTKRVPPLRNFILLQGKGTSTIHVARTVCRRAEGKVGKAICQQNAEDCEQYVIAMKYLNRLSDWIFTVARYYSFAIGQPEILA